MTVSFKDWIDEKTRILEKNRFLDDARFTCTQLVLNEIKQNQTYLLIHQKELLSNNQRITLESQFQQIQQGIPLPYIIGEWDFFGLTLKVSKDVLIPRPETELLVESAIDWLKKQQPENRKMLDVGTGSGCIPIAILKNVPQSSAIAIDISFKALQITQDNRNRHALQNTLSLLCSDLVSSLNGSFNLITANLPYIPTQNLDSLFVKDHEPFLALDGGEDGLVLIKELLIQVVDRITKSGLILLEIEENQGKSVSTLAKLAFPNGKISIIKDYAHRDRIIRIEL